MLYFDVHIAGESCVCDCSPQDRQIGSQGPNAVLTDCRTNLPHHAAGAGDVAKSSSSGSNLRLQSLLGLRPLTGKLSRVAFECNSSLDHELAFGWVEGSTDRHRQCETIQQLRVKRTLLRVHTAKKYKLRWMGDAQAFTFHNMNPAGNSVQQSVAQMCREKIHFIDIKHAAMCLGKQSRLEDRITLQGAREIKPPK